MRYALKFAYSGKNFYGYARQPTLKTVEGSILKILVRKGIIEDTKKSVLRSASRTDKGVSSLGNVISFNSSFNEEDILDSLSKESDNIIFYGVQKAPKNFNPRFAKSRQYRYSLLKNYCFE